MRKRVLGRCGAGHQALKVLSMAVSADLHARPLKFRWSQLQKRPWICEIRGWWEGVKGFRLGGGRRPPPPLKATRRPWKSP